MKYALIALALATSGCATVVSEYNYGCRDGIGSVNINGQGPLGESDSVNKFCDSLEAERAAKKNLDREHGKSGR